MHLTDPVIARPVITGRRRGRLPEGDRRVETVPVEILVLGHDTVTALLTVEDCIPVMREALTALARGDGHQPLRSIVRPPGLDGFLGLMPGYVGGDEPVLGMKFLGIFPGNPALGKDAHQGLVLLLSPQTGEPLAVVDASAVTAVRTAAVSAVATEVLARVDATDLTIIGIGVQGAWHARAIAAVRPLTRVRLVGRNVAQGNALAAKLYAELAVPVEFGTDARAALEGAEIVVTATTSTTPVLERSWIAAGTHINAVGSAVPHARELDTATVVDSVFVVDRMESALVEAGDYVIAAAEAGFGPERIHAELGDVLAGAAAGRGDDGQITVFKSLGLAIEDLAAVAYLYEQAKRLGAGTRAPF